MLCLRPCLLLLTLAVWMPFDVDAAENDDILTVGSVAPKLDIQHWFPQADGQTHKVTGFAKGKVYVVEFWATWCGPCLQNMPHLVQLQQQYAEKGVQIIGVTNEDVDTVSEFLSREVPQRAVGKPDTETPKTFGELTQVYSLAADPDQSTSKAYMEAAIQAAIPSAFIVGKDGKIEWIGHPAQMDEVLRQVVADSWNRDEFGKEFLADQQATKARAELNNALQRRDYDRAVRLIDARLKATDEPQEQLELRLTKIQISLATDQMPTAATQLKETFAFTGGRADMVDLICWHIYEQSEQRKNDMSSLIQIALAEGEKALASAKGASLASLLDTVGHLAYKSGDKAKAIKLVIQAIDLADGENKEFSKQFLQELQGK